MTADLAALRAAVEAATAALTEAEASAEATPPGAPDVATTTPSFADRGIEGKPPQQTTEDALAWIRAKFGKTRSEALAAGGRPVKATEAPADGAAASAADGAAEARRRIAARRAS